MRRLIGLIALLALFLGAAWLVQHDFDLRQVPGVTALVGPAPTDVPSGVSPDSGGEASDSSVTAPPAEEAAGDTGVASAPDQADVSPAVEPEAPAPAESEMAAAEPPVSDGGATADTPPVGVIPSFDIVRVEPSGNTVFAGLASPLAKVEVLDGAKSIATAEANERGEWALVLDEPLPPGTHDLAIRTTTPDQSKVTLSDQRVAVSVSENKDEEPLVVLNLPDGPSRLIQVPSESEIAAAPEAPMAESSKPAEETAAAAMSPAPGGKSASSADATTAGPEIAPAGETEVTTAEPMTEPSAMTPGVDDAGPPAAGSGVGDAPGAAPEMPSPDETEIAAVLEPMTEPSAIAPASEAAGETAPVAKTPSAGETEDATAPPPMAEPSAPVTDIGAAETPSPGEAAGTPMPDTASVPSEVPAGPQAPSTGEDTSAQAAVEEPAPVVPKVGVAAVEAETNGALYVAGTADTPEPVRVYIDDEFIGEATPGEAGTWLLETEREMAPDEYVIRADQVDAGSGAVIARAEVPFEREIEVAVLEQSGEAAVSGTAEVSGSVAGPMTVIIKRGDNLWRISRAIYGKGLRFSTIYQANRDQIRNPDLIYPGQVFVLPAGNTAWEAK